MRGPLIALLLLAGVIAPAGSAFAAAPKQPAVGADSIGIRLLAGPGVTSDNPLARTYIVDQLKPGTTITRTVEIYNTTGAIADISVYPAGASIVRGNIEFAPGHSQDELSGWTGVSNPLVRLPSGAQALDTLTIQVPANASPGERYAVLWAEVSTPPTIAGGLRMVNRVGVRMYLSIEAGGTLPSNFTIGALVAERSVTGERVVVATVHNTGQSTLDITGDLSLPKGPGGLRAGPFAATLGPILAPHSAELVSVRIDAALPRGPWRAELSLTSGLIHRSAVATITFPFYTGVAKGDSPLTLVTLVLLVLLMIIALALLVLFGHRSRRRGVHAATHAQ